LVSLEPEQGSIVAWSRLTDQDTGVTSVRRATLVELLILVTILVMLLALVSPQVTPTTGQTDRHRAAPVPHADPLQPGRSH
jgi:hypothetical protein